MSATRSQLLLGMLVAELTDLGKNPGRDVENRAKVPLALARTVTKELPTLDGGLTLALVVEVLERVAGEGGPWFSYEERACPSIELTTSGVETLRYIAYTHLIGEGIHYLDAWTELQKCGIEPSAPRRSLLRE